MFKPLAHSLSQFLLCLCVGFVFLSKFCAFASLKEAHQDFKENSTVSNGVQIVKPPRNTIVLENLGVEMSCGAIGTSTTITYRWYREDILISELSLLADRAEIRPGGSLLIKPTKGDDSGKYTCVATNEIEETDTAFAYLRVEYPARVFYSPEVQYLTLGLSGTVMCYIQSSPPVQYVSWFKDGRPLVYTPPNVKLLDNGSLYLNEVTQQHQGRYRCVPYNIQGTGETSNLMQVVVREPPVFTVKPAVYYFASTDENVTMPCAGRGTPKPCIIWKRVTILGTSKLPENRTILLDGNLTIANLRMGDSGKYECILENEIATLLSQTDLLVNGTIPFPPTNVMVNASSSAATIMWEPNFESGLPQNLTIRYRFSGDGESMWRTMRVLPLDSTVFTLYNLQPDTEYEFQVMAYNRLEGYGSKIFRVRTTKRKAEESKESNEPTKATDAITAWVLGGVLSFVIVVIILSVCIAKMFNKRKQNKKRDCWNAKQVHQLQVLSPNS